MLICNTVQCSEFFNIDKVTQDTKSIRNINTINKGFDINNIQLCENNRLHFNDNITIIIDKPFYNIEIVKLVENRVHLPYGGGNVTYTVDVKVALVNDVQSVIYDKIEFID